MYFIFIVVLMIRKRLTPKDVVAVKGLSLTSLLWSSYEVRAPCRLLMNRIKQQNLQSLQNATLYFKLDKKSRVPFFIVLIHTFFTMLYLFIA
jgi:hypothetical protein